MLSHVSLFLLTFTSNSWFLISAFSYYVMAASVLDPAAKPFNFLYSYRKVSSMIGGKDNAVIRLMMGWNGKIVGWHG